MGADIHYAIERRHPQDGAWETVVFSHVESVRKTGPVSRGDYDAHLRRAAMRFKSRNYAWFALLAEVRGDLGGGPVAHQGFPVDVSGFALEKLGPYDPDMHSQCWLSLPEIRHVFADPEIRARLPGDIQDDVPEYYQSALEDLLAEYGPDGPTEIHLGRVIDDAEMTVLPDKASAPAHDKIATGKREAGFGPFVAENIRILFAFDN